MDEDFAVGLTVIVGFALLLASFAAWGTHVIVSIQNESWLFLIAGAIAAPVGVLHGVGIWFGLF